MQDKRRDRDEFVVGSDGVEDVPRGWKFKREPDGRLNGNVPFDAGMELDAEFVESLETAQKVDEEWLRRRGGEEPSMDE